MIRNYQKVIFGVIFLLFLVSLPRFLLALEISYPSIEFGGRQYGITEKTTLPELIAYIYYFVLGLGGIISLAVMLWGGICYLTSLGNPEAMRGALKRILAALLGLTILLGSFLILKTISPELVTLKPLELEKAEKIEVTPKEELEVRYPVLEIAGKKYTITKKTGLSELIAFIYYYVLIFGGIIALAFLIYGGIRYLLSAGKPEAVSEAKKQVLAALLGLAILLSSFLILKTISPELVTLKEVELKKPEKIEAPPYEIPEKPLPEYIKYVFNVSIGIGGLIAFLALIYGGILYLTSVGDPERIRKARSQILAAFSGLLILLSSYLILTIIDPRLVILEFELPKILKLKKIEFPEIAVRKLPTGLEEISIKSVIDEFFKLEKEILKLTASTAKATNEIAFLSRGCDECLADFDEEFADLGAGEYAKEEFCQKIKLYRIFDKNKKEDKKEIERLKKLQCPSCSGCERRGGCLSDLIKSMEQDLNDALEQKKELEELGGCLADLARQLMAEMQEKKITKPRLFILPGLIRLAENCVCEYGETLCLCDCSPAWCVDEKDPLICPSELKEAIGEVLVKSLEGKALVMELDKKIQELEVLKVELEEKLKKIRDCRTDPHKDLYNCSQAKDQGIIKECQELDFYCYHY